MLHSNNAQTRQSNMFCAHPLPALHALPLLSHYVHNANVAPQPYLKFHNPRTFEDMDKPIPNFKKFGLKSGATRRQQHQQRQQHRSSRSAYELQARQHGEQQLLQQRQR
jgi:hypothetical protein